MNIVGLPYVYQTGSVVTDPSLPVQNVDAKVNIAAVFYNRTFSFFGRSASALADASLRLGQGYGQTSASSSATVTRSGQGDMTSALRDEHPRARRP